MDPWFTLTEIKPNPDDGAWVLTGAQLPHDDEVRVESWPQKETGTWARAHGHAPEDVGNVSLPAAATDAPRTGGLKLGGGRKADAPVYTDHDPGPDGIEHLFDLDEDEEVGIILVEPPPPPVSTDEDLDAALNRLLMSQDLLDAPEPRTLFRPARPPLFHRLDIDDDEPMVEVDDDPPSIEVVPRRPF